MAKQLPVTEFDILTLPSYLQLFKALIPFMEYGMQKKLSMLIRANELKHTLNFYNSPYSCNTFKTCSNSSGINANTSLNDILNNEAIMKTIISYCPDNIEQLINTYQNFSKMSDIFNMMDMFNNSDNNCGFGSSNNNSTGSDNTGSGSFNNVSSNEFNNNNSNDNSEFSNFNNNTGSGGFNNININNILNSSQKDMYNEYIKQLDKLDFNDGNNYGSSNNN